MSGRGQTVDMELLGQPAQGRASLIGSDQLVDFGVGQKSGSSELRWEEQSAGDQEHA